MRCSEDHTQAPLCWLAPSPALTRPPQQPSWAALLLCAEREAGKLGGRRLPGGGLLVARSNSDGMQARCGASVSRTGRSGVCMGSACGACFASAEPNARSCSSVNRRHSQLAAGQAPALAHHFGSPLSSTRLQPAPTSLSSIPARTPAMDASPEALARLRREVDADGPSFAAQRDYMRQASVGGGRGSRSGSSRADTAAHKLCALAAAAAARATAACPPHVATSMPTTLCIVPSGAHAAAARHRARRALRRRPAQPPRAAAGPGRA